ncbi:MAG TPA: hypothetical protein VK726_00535, partial [Acetobacteraceae bacterium]|nr:hypothetical protein [Acetobacteraceae bacterium]
IPSARQFPEKAFDFLDGSGFDLAPLGNRSGSPAARTGVACGYVVVRHGIVHLDQGLRLRQRWCRLTKPGRPGL